MVATDVVEEDQVADAVRSFVVLSLKEPVAVSCCAEPVWIVGEPGLTEIDSSDAFPPPDEPEPPHAATPANAATIRSVGHREFAIPNSTAGNSPETYSLWLTPLPKPNGLRLNSTSIDRKLEIVIWHTEHDRVRRS